MILLSICISKTFPQNKSLARFLGENLPYPSYNRLSFQVMQNFNCVSGTILDQSQIRTANSPIIKCRYFIISSWAEIIFSLFLMFRCLNRVLQKLAPSRHCQSSRNLAKKETNNEITLYGNLNRMHLFLMNTNRQVVAVKIVISKQTPTKQNTGIRV